MTETSRTSAVRKAIDVAGIARGAGLLQDIRRQARVAEMSRKFHSGLALVFVDVAEKSWRWSALGGRAEVEVLRPSSRDRLRMTIFEDCSVGVEFARGGLAS